MTDVAAEFGLTNDISRIALANAYREAAVADGWAVTPGNPNESVETYAHLRREGFTMHVLARHMTGRFAARVSINIWGPDGMSIKPPDVYDWAKIKAGVRHCNTCDADDIVPHRFSFAGRCCSACLPRMREQHERPGWTL